MTWRLQPYEDDIDFIVCQNKTTVAAGFSLRSYGKEINANLCKTLKIKDRAG